MPNFTNFGQKFSFNKGVEGIYVYEIHILEDICLYSLSIKVFAIIVSFLKNVVLKIRQNKNRLAIQLTHFQPFDDYL